MAKQLDKCRAGQRALLHSREAVLVGEGQGGKGRRRRFFSLGDDSVWLTVKENIYSCYSSIEFVPTI